MSTTKEPAPNNVVLRTENITKRFSRVTAVDNLELEVHRGDIFGLLGPNGSGKTTTLRMVLSLIHPTHGDVMLFGQRLTQKSRYRAALRRVGAIVEQPVFYPFLSGRDNLHGIAIFSGLPDNLETQARIEELLVLVGISERAKDSYSKYSLGMKQRLGIAAALLHRPELLVLDEPTNGLDPAGVAAMRNLITQLAQQGITVILSSHILHEVQQVCSRVAIIQYGRLLMQGDVKELLEKDMGILLGFKYPDLLDKAEEVLRALPREEVPWLEEIQRVPPEQGAWVPPGGILLHIKAPLERATDINVLLGARGIYAAEIRRRERTLEQIYLQMTGTMPAGPLAYTPPGYPQMPVYAPPVPVPVPVAPPPPPFSPPNRPYPEQ